MKVKRRTIVEHFRVNRTDTKMWNRILKGNPTSFANVRHPFERLVSAYLDSVVNWKTKPASQTKENLSKYEGQSFKDFVTSTVLREAKESTDMMYSQMFTDWRPYHTHCNFCKVPFKVISKMETFDEDRGRILKMLGVEDEKKDIRLRVHGGNQIQNMTMEYFKNIPKEVKNELLELYQYEFDMFNYDKYMY